MKKRILACIVFMVVLCTAFSAFADEPELPITGSCGQYLRYEYYQSTKTLTIIGNGNMPNYPANKYEGSIAPWRNNSNIDNYLEKVVISDGVTNIGENAFLWCDKITSVTIPNSVKSIGMGAFYSCKALTGITIPNGAESIGEDAFQYCDSLKEVTIPGSVKSIGEGAFSGCSSLTDITIPQSVTSIGNWAFNGCSALKNITLSDGITNIGYQAFYNTGYYNADGEESNWENNALYIGNYLIEADAWKLNNGILNGEIPSEYIIKPGTKTIADMAFTDCKGYIEHKDFENCVGLTSIKLPDGMVNIGNKAFDGCTKLTSMDIPDSVSSIGNSAFSSCVSLTGISVSEGNASYCAENGVLYNKAKTEILRFPCQKKDTSFTIPNGAKNIADGAFENCRNLTSITIPNGVKNIGDDAFSICFGLTSITIPDGVTSIGNSAFYQCTGLTSITIPNSVLIIGENAFEGCRTSMKVYYTGSEADWGEVIGDGKSVLKDTNIYYCKGITATRNDDGTIKVSPNKIDSGTVILALYGGDKGDKLIEMQSEKYSGTKITFTPTQTYTRAKIMIWNSLGGMSPECGIKNVR